MLCTHTYCVKGTRPDNTVVQMSLETFSSFYIEGSTQNSAILLCQHPTENSYIPFCCIDHRYKSSNSIWILDVIYRLNIRLDENIVLGKQAWKTKLFWDCSKIFFSTKFWWSKWVLGARFVSVQNPFYVNNLKELKVRASSNLGKFLTPCHLFRAFSPTRPHWAELVIESPCPSVDMCVCVSAPSGAVFFEASHWPSGHMTRSRPLIGQT